MSKKKPQNGETSKRRNGRAKPRNPQSAIRNPQSDDLPLVEPKSEQTCTSRGIQTVPVIRCPACRSEQVSKNGTGVGVIYYKCRRCNARFKVRLIEQG